MASEWDYPAWEPEEDWRGWQPAEEAPPPVHPLWQMALDAEAMEFWSDEPVWPRRRTRWVSDR